MSVEALAVVLHHSRARGTDKLILLGIANHAGDGGAWPSVETLARYAGGVDETTVRRALRRLERLGEVLVHVQAGGPSGIPAWRRPNRYEVLVACPATCDRTHNHRVARLPKAPADLCITGGAPTPPGGASARGGGAPTPPDGGAPTPPEPSLEPPLNPDRPSASTTDRAREPRCSVCSLPADVCRQRVETSGHEYVPDPRGRQ